MMPFFNVAFHKMLGRVKAVQSANLSSTNLNCGKESLTKGEYRKRSPSFSKCLFPSSDAHNHIYMVIYKLYNFAINYIKSY